MTDSFPCKRCGACCRNIGRIIGTESMVLPNGICKFLDQTSNLCTQYNTRPIFCNVDEFYDKYLFNSITRKEYYLANLKTCEKLRKLENENSDGAISDRPTYDFGYDGASE